MLIDLTLELTPQRRIVAQGQEQIASMGHLGTHFDVMNQRFPLEFTRRAGICFDVSKIMENEIMLNDGDLGRIEEGMFVGFYTGYIDRVDYGTQAYFKQHPQLSYELIEALILKRISIIGIDCAGVRRGSEHTPIDQRCADQGVFIVENLCHLDQVLSQSSHFIAHTYPMNFAGLTGLPCRVIAEL